MKISLLEQVVVWIKSQNDMTDPLFTKKKKLNNVMKRPILR